MAKPALPTPAYRRVVLMGFMGAGKTTVGRLLAPLLGWRFIDMDAVLVERRGASVAALFESFGEAQFRVWEAAAVAAALGEERVVIALGGGAVEHRSTRFLLQDHLGTLTVFLETPLEVALARCEAEPGAAERPVLADRARLEQRYTARLPMYRGAKLTLAAAKASPAALAERVRAALGEI